MSQPDAAFWDERRREHAAAVDGRDADSGSAARAALEEVGEREQHAERGRVTPELELAPRLPIQR